MYRLAVDPGGEQDAEAIIGIQRWDDVGEARRGDRVILQLLQCLPTLYLI